MCVRACTCELTSPFVCVYYACEHACVHECVRVNGKHILCSVSTKTEILGTVK